MANQVVVTNSGNVQVSIEPQPNVQVQISRAAIGNITVSNVSTANFANYAGNVVNANQPNITSLGTLTGLTSSGNITAPFFLGNVIGNISGNLVVPGSNTSVLYNNQGNAGASDAFQFNQASNTVTIGGNLVGGNISGNGAGIANIAGANVTGQVSFANVANSVAGANVSGEVAFANTANNVAVGNVVGIGNIATVNLDGNASNILYGNGSFAAPAVVNNVANANYANFAGTAFSVAGANVTGTVANANYAAYAGNATIANSANSVAGANVTGTVANANYASFAGTAYSVSGSNVSGEVANANYATFAGTAYSVSGSNISGTVANANYAAYAGDIINASQPNITSVGNLSALTVTGNISAGNINGGNLVSANYLSGDGYLISNLSVGAGSQIVNGNSNVTVTANSNVNTSVAGVANVYVVTSTGANLTGNMQITGNLSDVDSITFDTANAGNGIVAQMSWDDGQGTVDLVLKGGNVTAKLAEQEYARVYNAEANTLSKGEIVYVYGAQGNLISVKRAQANVEATSNGTLGMVAETISAGGEGFVQTTGAIYKLNTNGLVAGNAIYLSPTTPGGYTQTKPVAPDQLVILGWVERVSTTVGSIYLKVDNGYELDELHNVLITSPSAGQALVYNSSNLWINGNPNQANYASVANSVAGANVSGEVANANYASYANIANSANSVNVANVVGIGNIATLNLDGSSSNILYGNGTFAAPTTGTIIANGTTNVSIPVANGPITFSANGNANIANLDGNGSLFLLPKQGGFNNALRIDNYGRSGNTGASRIASFRYRGNSSAQLSVQPNDGTMEFLTVAHNGTALQTNSTASIRATVDNSYTANGANIPLGWQIIVNDTNGGVNNQFKIHNFYSNGNVNFANSVVANNDFYTSYGNITANLGVFYGNGSGLSAIAGANVTGEVPYASIANSVAVANVSGIGNIATINLDGNSSNVLLGNGVFSSVPTSISATIANGTSNINIPAANGNITVNINNNANVLNFESGSILMNASPLSTQTNVLRINTIGNPQTDAHRIAWARSRGTIASPTSVQANDRVGSMIFFAHNGTGFSTTYSSFIRAIVDSAYTANTANIPIGLSFVVAQTTETGSSNTNISHNFWSNGNVSFNKTVVAADFTAGNSISAVGNIFATGNISYTGNLNLIKFKEQTYIYGNATGTITPDLNNGSIQFLTLTGNITLNSLANAVAGSSATFVLTQDSTGNRILSSTWKFASGLKTLSTGANSVDIISVFYDGGTYYATLTTGYA